MNNTHEFNTKPLNNHYIQKIGIGISDKRFIRNNRKLWIYNE